MHQLREEDVFFAVRLDPSLGDGDFSLVTMSLLSLTFM